jgi:hypothetical protein
MATDLRASADRSGYRWAGRRRRKHWLTTVSTISIAAMNASRKKLQMLIIRRVSQYKGTHDPESDYHPRGRILDDTLPR